MVSPEPRHWFVTGASGGLGRSIVEYALEHGDVVTATVRRAAALDDLRERFGDRLEVEVLDLAPPAEVDDLIARVVARRGVDVVVNNAGYALVGALEEMTAAQIRDQLEVLLVAPILITRAFLAPMRARGGGRIIQISSLGGQAAIATHSCYHAGKWGLEGFTESVAQEVADFGIRLTLVEPGGTRTDFLSGMQFTEASPAYRDTGVDRIRRSLRTTTPDALATDPRRVAAVIYDITRQDDPPLRIPLGADAYAGVHDALAGRLTALEAREDVAHSVAHADSG